MKKAESVKELYPKINSLLGEIDNEMKESIKKIKKDYINIMTQEKIDLLKNICENEKLDFNEMKKKYLTEKEIKFIKEKSNIIEFKNEILLDTISINNTTYYYENKENGSIYDNKSKIVGSIKNGQPVLI